MTFRKKQLWNLIIRQELLVAISNQVVTKMNMLDEGSEGTPVIIVEAIDDRIEILTDLRTK
jgi:hypothetical protein